MAQGRWRTVVPLVGLAAVIAAAAVPQSVEQPLAAFRRLRAEGSAARSAGDLAAADSRFRAALRIFPCHPGVLLTLAEVESAAGDRDAAAVTLARYASYGFSLPPSAEAELSAVRASPRGGSLALAFARNATGAGVRQIVFQTGYAPVLVEKIAFGADGALLVGAVHTPGVFRVRGSILAPFSESGAVGGVFGLEADDRRDDLWAASSSPPQVDHPPYAGSALVRLDLRTGRLKAKYPLPRNGPQQWGDLTVGPDGTVFASDGLSGEIWRLRPGAAALERLVPSGRLGSPQGMVVSPDGRRLIVADYSTGMHWIDLASGVDRALPLPSDLCLIGVDGLLRRGDALIGVQNGVTPQRIVRLQLDRDWTRITGWTTLVANHPLLSEPTSGAVRGRRYYFVSRSQWSDFSDSGAPKSSHIEPAVIASIPLSLLR